MLQPSATIADLDYATARLWYALLVTNSKEQKAADWLKCSHVYAYWPNYVKQVYTIGLVNGRGRRSARLSAVMPGYLFIAGRVGGPDPWDVVRETPGVYGYVRDGNGRAASMEDADIEIVRKIEGGLNLPLPPAKEAHRFKIGDKVRFIDDLLGRWPPGVVSALADDGGIRVDVPMLMRVVPIWAFAHQIERM